MPAREMTGSMAELLMLRARQEPDRIGFIFLVDGSTAELSLSYGALDRNARRLAANLLAHADPGDRALLYYPAGLDFLIAFFACSYAGLIAVPAGSPREQASHDHSLRSLVSMAADCAPRLVLTTSSVLDRTGGDAPLPLEGARWLATDAMGGGDGLTDIRLPRPEDLAFLQYTSGSTATPKGVMISHRNLLANLDAVLQTTRQTRDSVCVTWLPHFHDMGLGGLLGSLYGDYPCVFMSPLAFLGRPLRWLRAITRYRGTWSGAPNFAFDLCCRHVRSTDIGQLDLRSWQLVANGAEPVRKETIDRFTAIFAPAGFNPRALMPCYGLAEAVVFVSGTAEREPPIFVAVDADALKRGKVVDGTGSPASARWQVACGRPAPLHEFRIVDPKTRRPCAPDTVGEIWWSGPSVAEGYWRRPQESEQVFRATLAGDPATKYLRTGDVGFAWKDQVVVTGRLKDVIIVAGTNHFPQDIEASVEQAHPAIRPGGVAAFAVPSDGDRLVVVAEISGALAETACEDIMTAIRQAVADAHQLRLSGIALMQPKTLLKTTSGKIRRQAMRELWLAGTARFIAQWRGQARSSGEAEDVVGGVVPKTAAPAAMDQIKSRVLTLVRRQLGAPDLAIDLDAPIDRLGLSSIDVAELRAAIEQDLGVGLSLGQMIRDTTLRDILSALRDGVGAVVKPTAGSRQSAFETVVNPEIGRLLRQLRLDRRYVRGSGSSLTDAEGREVLDAIANYGAVPFGHNHPRIWQALDAVRDAGEPNLVQPSALDAAGELAERLIAVAPPGLHHVTFANSGAEATEAALKLARAATGRRRLLSTADGFHGKTLGALSVTGRSAYQLPFGAPVQDVEFVRFGDGSALEQVFASRGNSFAGFIVEPLQGEGGIIEPPAGYLRHAAGLCRQYGVKLIVDEIQTGLGRTGALFACEHEDLTPDMLLLAKALGGGLMPIGALLYRATSYSAEFALKHTSTFAGNSLACRAGLAALELLTRDDRALVRQVAELGGDMKSGLQRIAEKFPGILRAVRGRGFMLGLELSNKREDFGAQTLLGILAEQGHLAALVASYLLNVEGVRVAPTLLSNNVVRIEPPLTFTAAECGRVVAACERAIAQLARRDTAAAVNHLLERPRAAIGGGVAAAHGAGRSSAPKREAVEADWAFIAHPVDIASYQHFDHSMAAFTGAEVAELAERWKGLLDPFVAGSTRIVGADAVARGQFVVVPATAQDLLNDRPAAVLNDIRAAVARARDGGAKVIGLGGYVSILTRGGLDLADAGVALTTGNSYTAITAVTAIEHALGRLDRTLNDSTVAIVGAAGSVGQALTYLLAERAARIVLLGNPAHPEVSMRSLRRIAELAVGSLLRRRTQDHGGPLAGRVHAVGSRNGRSLEEMTGHLMESGDIVIGVDPAVMLRGCDVVVSATSSAQDILRPEYFKHGAAVCDVSRPRNVTDRIRSERPDVLAFEGGLVEVPQCPDFGWHFGLPAGVAFACMCEPMILALERRFDAAPVGAGLFGDYIDQLRLWSARHGFRLSELRGFDRTFTESDWQRWRRLRSERAAPDSTYDDAPGPASGLVAVPVDGDDACQMP